MAKELPYFKFEPNQWENGNVQICSRESKGLFIDLCSVYWSRLGEMPYALALQKHCNGNEDALTELVNYEIIVVNEGQIIIEFLDEQLNEFQETSDKRRKAANKRWSDASAKQKQSKSNAIKEEEKREEEKREEKKDISVEFVEPVQLEIQPIKVKPTKPVKTTKPKSEVTVFRNKFESIYKESRGLDFYWTAADATNCKQLIAKIKKSFTDHGFEYAQDVGLGSFERMMAVDDSWIQDNMSVKILNSKYNEIINSLKNGKKGSSANETQSRRDEINRLLQEKRNKVG